FSKKGLFMAAKIVGVTVLLFVLLILGLFAYYRKDLDAIRPGELDKRVQSTVIKYYDRNGALLWEDKGAGDYRLVVTSDNINTYMKQATVAIEDKDFYSHPGISFSGILRAFLNNSQGNATQGGSTLTQQLVKQVFFPPDEAQQRGVAGIPRKIKEMILSVEVERMYNKDQILTLYLNESPYGGRRNGVESAAQTYFHKSAKDLTLAESALLAAIPNNPSVYNPYDVTGHVALIERQHKVLDSMADMKYISREQAEEAKKVAVLDTLQPLADQLAGIKAPHFVLMVKAQLEKELGKATVGQGGLTVVTTLDLTAQSKLEANMTAMFDGTLTDRNCSYVSCPSYAGFTNGAAAIEDVETGQLIALVGSRDYGYPGFGQDNAATAFIQPGSTIKPFVYAQLFQKQADGKPNFGSGSILSDTSTTFPGNYKPQNADGKFQGNINIRQSLDRSRNIPAIKAMVIAGKDETWATIRAMGDVDYCTQGPDQDAGLSSAIGGCGTRLTDHTNAIASFARMGVYMPQTTILKVTNSTGEVIKQYKSETKQVIDPQAAYIVNDILGDSNARAGLGWNQDYLVRLNKAGIKAAAKTGTSNGQIGSKIVPKDIWTVGYTPHLSMSVWLGNPDTTPLRQGNSLIPAMIYDKTMMEVSQYYIDSGKAKGSDWFTAPSGIQRVGNEVYPSYWNKSSGITNTKATFDRVSKKKATDCTPTAAKIELSVSKITDPYTKKDIISAPDGYDGSADDDIHSCSDPKPYVTLSTSGNTAMMSFGTSSSSTFQPMTIELRSPSGVIATKQVTSNDSWGVDLTGVPHGTQLTATVTDTGYYTDSATTTY
ncbi:MAG: penicillin-binding protein, partial [Candidatus Saccharimonas sp.]|nr:penicillin-binding protein [Candidatus Saccharimonas sp.]